MNQAAGLTIAFEKLPEPLGAPEESNGVSTWNIVVEGCYSPKAKSAIKYPFVGASLGSYSPSSMGWLRKHVWPV